MSTQTKRFDLDKIKVASPCNMSWNDMKGDDRTRHCSSCQLNVYNIAGLSKSEAQELLAKRAAGERVCVRLLRRQDGTIITKDCPVGVSLARRARLRLASLSASIVALVVGFTSLRSHAGEREIMGKVAVQPFAPGIDEIAGGIAYPVEVEPQPQATPEPSPEKWWNTKEGAIEEPMMGEIAPYYEGSDD